MKIKAINKIYQTKVNRAVEWLMKYNEYNRQRDIADDYDNTKEYNRLNKLCESSFDKYLTIVDELPKREKNNIENSTLY